ncbi:MAG: peptidylprolyl isomerase [Bradyrhizobium sp.]|nr:MAG: peptidylprolyl isomerase [Bradyrhizobium sp.]
MSHFSRRVFLAVSMAAVAFPAFADDDENTLILNTKHGKVVIRLWPKLAPKTVAQVKKLAKRKFYDGLTFHRVIPGFMAQTGDPKGDGSGGSDLPDIPAEFNAKPFTRGTVGMARSSEPNSANSQFFICLGDADFLDGKYTAFGEVVTGMDVVDQIKAGSQDNDGAVDHPDKIITLRLASADKPKAKAMDAPDAPAPDAAAPAPAATPSGQD